MIEMRLRIYGEVLIGGRGRALGVADDRFLQMFYEEARELLLSLEEGLMDLERRQGDRAHLDRTLAAHSIKGAAAMVGLAGIAEFTHGIEAVLDRIRSGTLAVDSDIITTLLEARDHLSAAVEARGGMRSPIPPPGELNRRLAGLLRDTNGPPPARPPTPPPRPRSRRRGSPPPRSVRAAILRPSPPSVQGGSGEEVGRGGQSEAAGQEGGRPGAGPPRGAVGAGRAYRITLKPGRGNPPPRRQRARRPRRTSASSGRQRRDRPRPRPAAR